MMNRDRLFGGGLTILRWAGGLGMAVLGLAMALTVGIFWARDEEKHER